LGQAVTWGYGLPPAKMLCPGKSRHAHYYGFIVMVPAKDEASALTGQPALQTSLAAWHVKCFAIASWLQAESAAVPKQR
jgi:hypothetical protein